MLTKGSIRPNPIRFDRVFHNDFGVYTVESRRDEGDILYKKPFIEPNASDIQRVGTGNIADTVDASDESGERPPCELRTISQLGGQKCVVEKKACLPDETWDTDDLGTR